MRSFKFIVHLISGDKIESVSTTEKELRDAGATFDDAIEQTEELLSAVGSGLTTLQFNRLNSGTRKARVFVQATRIDHVELVIDKG